MMLALLTISLSVVPFAKSSGPDKPDFCHGLDCPIFVSKEKTNDYELRSYKPGTHRKFELDAHRIIYAQYWRFLTRALQSDSGAYARRISFDDPADPAALR
jgi:hypothetical protein